MLAIIQQWDGESGCYTDKYKQYLFLILFKVGLDVAVWYLCYKKLYVSFLSMCSVFIILSDVVMAFFMTTVCFIGAERSPVPPCFLLAYASATFGALPLPMMCLGLLDYYLEDTCIGNQTTFSKCLRNVVLTLLVWMLAGIYSFGSVSGELLEMNYITGLKALVCEVEEATVIIYFVLVILAAVICSLVPFWSRIPQWIKEADRLFQERDHQDKQGSDLFFTKTACAETESDDLEGTMQPRPALWLSLTLGFGMFWIPYFLVSTVCLVLGYGVPAYITVNLLWLECANSLLVGIIFWWRSTTQGPYSNLPENVCSWHIYWHLSKEIQYQKQPIAVFNPAQSKRKNLLNV